MRTSLASFGWATMLIPVRTMSFFAWSMKTTPLALLSLALFLLGVDSCMTTGAVAMAKKERMNGVAMNMHGLIL